MVDFGSGGGIDCFLAAREVGDTGAVIGVDITSDMVDLARKNALTLGLSNVKFHLADMEDTPITDASVDVIMSTEASVSRQTRTPYSAKLSGYCAPAAGSSCQTCC